MKKIKNLTVVASQMIWWMRRGP